MQSIHSSSPLVLIGFSLLLRRYVWRTPRNHQNHLHVLMYVGRRIKRLNKLVGNGKRFLAYEIIKRLESNNMDRVLDVLKAGVQENEKRKGKKHQVFRLPFDARICHSERMIKQKLDYNHSNPVTGKWDLAEDFVKYPHSSAAFYELGKSIPFPLSHYKDI